ncbi:MAG: response regulator [Abitibacteriaceae bacterium]|nr:response regulator [Abditibacteriaceae bacterium]
MNATILIIEDEAAIRRFVRPTLAAHGYDLIEAEDAAHGLVLAAERLPDVVLLDLGLPDSDGLDVLAQLREWTHVPIIILSARDQEKDKVAALDAGADDYLTKPFGVSELLARLRVALRHAAQTQAGTPEPIFQTGELRVDLARRHVYIKDQEVHLTPIEYRLLTELVRHAGKVLTHRHLLREVWGSSYSGESHYLRVHMGGLRRKIEENSARPCYLLTEPGIGYRLAIE